MQSSGGMATVEASTQRPVSMLMSGRWPVSSGDLAGRMAGFENVVTLDMGGTSADIGVAAGGQLRMRHLPTRGWRLPGDGADGRRHDRGGRQLDRPRGRGRLQVGPSAGADPAPPVTDGAARSRPRPTRSILGGFGRQGLLEGRCSWTGLARTAMEKSPLA
jgi:N-methylhydantoinase A/oxoprolinase/acetone carboxylase beta subunit